MSTVIKFAFYNFLKSPPPRPAESRAGIRPSRGGPSACSYRALHRKPLARSPQTQGAAVPTPPRKGLVRSATMTPKPGVLHASPSAPRTLVHAQAEGCPAQGGPVSRPAQRLPRAHLDRGRSATLPAPQEATCAPSLPPAPLGHRDCGTEGTSRDVVSFGSRPLGAGGRSGDVLTLTRSTGLREGKGRMRT